MSIKQISVLYTNKTKREKQKESLPEASSITDTRDEKKRVKKKQVLSVY